MITHESSYSFVLNSDPTLDTSTLPESGIESMNNQPDGSCEEGKRYEDDGKQQWGPRLFGIWCRKCDVITINCPLHEGTIDLFDRERISKMKPGAWLVNTARGRIANTEAVVEALKSGHLSGESIISPTSGFWTFWMCWATIFRNHAIII